MHGEVERRATQVDLVAEESLVDATRVALSAVPAELSADVPCVSHRETRAAEDHVADRGSVRNEIAGEHEVFEVNEIAGLAVAPVDDRDAGADVRLNRTSSPEGQETDRSGHRDLAQLEFLCDLEPVI